MTDVYWYSDPMILLKPPYRLFPSPDMTPAQRSNSFVLLILLITLVLFLVGYKGWWLFLLFGLLVALVIAIIEQSRVAPVQTVEHYVCPRRATYKPYRSYR